MSISKPKPINKVFDYDAIERGGGSTGESRIREVIESTPNVPQIKIELSDYRAKGLKTRISLHKNQTALLSLVSLVSGGGSIYALAQQQPLSIVGLSALASFGFGTAANFSNNISRRIRHINSLHRAAKEQGNQIKGSVDYDGVVHNGNVSATLDKKVPSDLQSRTAKVFRKTFGR